MARIRSSIYWQAATSSDGRLCGAYFLLGLALGLVIGGVSVWPLVPLGLGAGLSWTLSPRFKLEESTPLTPI